MQKSLTCGTKSNDKKLKDNQTDLVLKLCKWSAIFSQIVMAKMARIWNLNWRITEQIPILKLCEWSAIFSQTVMAKMARIWNLNWSLEAVNITGMAVATRGDPGVRTVQLANDADTRKRETRAINIT